MRLLLEASLELSISGIYNVAIEVNGYQMGMNQFWRRGLPFFWINFFTLIAVMVFLVVGPPFILIYYLCSYKDWANEDFESRMGSVIYGFKKNKRWVLFYPFFFIVRRSVIAFQAVFQTDNFFAQVFTFLIMTLVQLIFLLVAKPFENPLM